MEKTASKYGMNIIIAFFLFCSCNEFADISDIDIQWDSPDFEIAITGSITSVKSYQKVILTKVRGLFEESFDSISGANVYVIDGIEKHWFVEQTEHPGFFGNTRQRGTYLSADSIFGTPSHRYTLVVEYNGKTYTASDSMVSTGPIDFTAITMPYINEDLGGVYFPGVDYIEIAFKAHEFGFENPLVWHWYTTNSSINFIAERYIYYHFGIDAQGMFSEWGYAILPQALDDTIWVEKYSISQEYDKYLVEVFKTIRWGDAYLSAIAANPPTNVSNNGTGYFYAADVKKNYIIVEDILKLVEGSK